MSTKAKATEIIKARIVGLQTEAAAILDKVASTDCWIERSTRPLHVHAAVKQLMINQGLTDERATAAMLTATALKQCQAALLAIHTEIAVHERHLKRLDAMDLS